MIFKVYRLQNANFWSSDELVFKCKMVKLNMRDKYFTELVWLSIIFIVLGVAVWLFGDLYWAGGYISTTTGWYTFVYGGIALILIGTLVWAYITHKARII